MFEILPGIFERIVYKLFAVICTVNFDFTAGSSQQGNARLASVDSNLKKNHR